MAIQWRAWLLLYSLPAWFAAFRASAVASPLEWSNAKKLAQLIGYALSTPDILIEESKDVTFLDKFS